MGRKTLGKRVKMEEDSSQSEGCQSPTHSHSPPASPQKKIKLLPPAIPSSSELQPDQMVVRMNCARGLDTSHNGIMMISLPKEYLYYLIQCPADIVADPTDGKEKRKGRNGKKTAECPYSFFEPDEVDFPKSTTFKIHICLYSSERGCKPILVSCFPPAIQACKYGAVFLPKEKLPIEECFVDQLHDAVAFLPICVNRTKKDCGNKNQTKLIAEVKLTIHNSELIARFYLPTKKHAKCKDPQVQEIPRSLWDSLFEGKTEKPAFPFQEPACNNAPLPCDFVPLGKKAVKSVTNPKQRITRSCARVEKISETPLKVQTTTTQQIDTSAQEMYSEILPTKYSFAPETSTPWEPLLDTPCYQDAVISDLIQVDTKQALNSQKLSQALDDEPMMECSSMDNQYLLLV